jgi:hypothetical protein
MNAKRNKTTAKKGDSVFWYAFGLEDNEPLTAIMLFDVEDGHGATLVVFDEVGTDTRRAVKHMLHEDATSIDRRRNGGWSFERSDLRIKAERMRQVEAAAKSQAIANEKMTTAKV